LILLVSISCVLATATTQRGLGKLKTQVTPAGNLAVM